MIPALPESFIAGITVNVRIFHKAGQNFAKILHKCLNRLFGIKLFFKI